MSEKQYNVPLPANTLRNADGTAYQANSESQMEEHLANLLSMGLSREQVSEKGYEYALALQTDQQKVGAYVPASMMAHAAEMVKDALPGAYRIYEVRNRIH